MLRELQIAEGGRTFCKRHMFVWYLVRQDVLDLSHGRHLRLESGEALLLLAPHRRQTGPVVPPLVVREARSDTVDIGWLDTCRQAAGRAKMQLNMKRCLTCISMEKFQL